MIFIKNDNTNPYINHAIEEYVLDKFSEDVFMLWRNESCILIGKNQNTLSEIDIDYVKQHNLAVVRRMSGGGAIFNDLGNLNFTFISSIDGNNFAHFERFTYPIINALKKLSINAELTGRNDLTIEGKKFSGNAQYQHRNRILHHGSILFSVDMSKLSQALKSKDIKFQDKAVKSVKDRVTNIQQYLNAPMDVIEFKQFLMQNIMKEEKNSKWYELTEIDWVNIQKICDCKYATWIWNYGHSPKFNYHNEKKFPGGIVQVNINIQKGFIKDVRFYGDFFSSCDIKELEDRFVGIRYSKEDLENAFINIDIKKYISNISKNNLVEIML
jgi:lipoate-protein ligase A